MPTSNAPRGKNTPNPPKASRPPPSTSSPGWAPKRTCAIASARPVAASIPIYANHLSCCRSIPRDRLKRSTREVAASTKANAARTSPARATTGSASPIAPPIPKGFSTGTGESTSILPGTNAAPTTLRTSATIPSHSDGRQIPPPGVARRARAHKAPHNRFPANRHEEEVVLARRSEEDHQDVGDDETDEEPEQRPGEDPPVPRAHRPAPGRIHSDT